MIGIEHDHLCSPPRGTAGLDSAGGAIEDLEERHQTARRAATGKPFAGRTQLGEVRATAGTELEDARLAHDAVEDPAFVYQIVLDAEDVAVVNDDVVR